jgi:hypothetical protein
VCMFLYIHFIVNIEQGFIYCREHKMNGFLYSSNKDGLSVI